MVILADCATNPAVLAVVRQRINLLAAGDYAGAQSLLNREGAARDWPPQTGESVIATYGVLPEDIGTKSSAERPARLATHHTLLAGGYR
jgi:hypothetical protein